MKRKKIKEIVKNGATLTLELQDELLYVVTLKTKDDEKVNHAWDLPTAMDLFDKLFESHSVKRGH
jgi:hypothetical protein